MSISENYPLKAVEATGKFLHEINRRLQAGEDFENIMQGHAEKLLQARLALAAAEEAHSLAETEIKSLAVIHMVTEHTGTPVLLTLKTLLETHDQELKARKQAAHFAGAPTIFSHN